MRTMSGMQPPLAGKLVVGDDDLGQMNALQLAKRLSVVLTDRVNAGMLSAYNLVALGRHPHTNWTGMLSVKDHEVIRHAFETVAGADLADRYLDELSDGEVQRVMVARALAQDTEVMILDELTAFLDLPRRVEVMRLLRHLAHDTNRAILLSTHDLDLALRSADRIWLLPKEGSLRAGAPEDLVLSGAFEAAFAKEGVVFDREAGSFHMRALPHRTVHLKGEGLPAAWTSRALERCGYQVLREGAEAISRVEIIAPEPAPRWRLIHRNTTAEYESVYALLLALQDSAVGIHD
jgi:iron complex transport system ATP-binding protein